MVVYIRSVQTIAIPRWSRHARLLANLHI